MVYCEKQDVLGNCEVKDGVYGNPYDETEVKQGHSFYDQELFTTANRWRVPLRYIHDKSIVTKVGTESKEILKMPDIGSPGKECLPGGIGATKQSGAGCWVEGVVLKSRS